MDLVIELLGPAYTSNSEGFYRSKSIEHFLNVVSGTKKGLKRLHAWYEPRYMDQLIRDIHQEADDLSAIFRCSTADVTPEKLVNFDFQRDVTMICEETAPKLRRVLMAAAQTRRAEWENKVKDPEPV
jgi:hypothetical protein